MTQPEREKLLAEIRKILTDLYTQRANASFNGVAEAHKNTELALVSLIEQREQDKWIAVTPETLPEDGQDVAFIVTGCVAHYAYENGRILGGRFHNSKHAQFSVPGSGYAASHWMPLPPSPLHP